MRPNSLFFDRGGRKGLARAVSMIITVVFLVLIGYSIIRYKHFAYLLRTELLNTPQFGWLVLCYVVLAVFVVLTIRWANCRVKRMPALWAVGVFLVALILRAVALLALRAPAFGGEVFGSLNLAAFVLPENLVSILFCAIPSLSAAVLYLIARRFDDGSAPAAGLLFALYPANIVLCLSQPVAQIVILFALLAVLFAMIAFSALRRGRAAAFAALSALSLAICAITLASAWVVALAFGVFWAVLLLSSFRIKKEPLRLVLIALVFCAVFFSLFTFVFSSPEWGRLDENLSAVNATGAVEQAREGEAILDSLDWAALKQGYNLVGKPVRLDANLTQLWLEKDDSLLAGTSSAAFSSSQLRPFAASIRLTDFFYIAAIFLFAWIGGLLRRRGGAGDLLLWVFLVWAVTHLFSDRQMITRALGVPILMIFASYGVFALVGTEPRPKERGKYDSCVNRGALNLGSIPETDEDVCSPGAFHPAVGAGRHTSGGLYASMETDLAKKEPQEPEQI
ncbi:MAG: hypothetical protein C0413_02820 [Clostridiales bacterium]|nr:hypothetical protein [Clostridiales bacterium]